MKKEAAALCKNTRTFEVLQTKDFIDTCQQFHSELFSSFEKQEQSFSDVIISGNVLIGSCKILHPLSVELETPYVYWIYQYVVVALERPLY